LWLALNIVLMNLYFSEKAINGTLTFEFANGMEAGLPGTKDLHAKTRSPNTFEELTPFFRNPYAEDHP
jgi:hypothetical protein